MSIAESDEIGKMFVGGLSWETDKETLHRYFSRYGEITDCVVMKNNITGRSRGFGFITFKDADCVPVVLSAGPHILDERTIDPKACTPRSLQKKKIDASPKLFLGGIPQNATETDIRNAFGKYGKVNNVVIMYDQENKRSKGFGFLSFDAEESVHRACAEQFVMVKGKKIECKRAESREQFRKFKPPQSRSLPIKQWTNNDSNYLDQTWRPPATGYGPSSPVGPGNNGNNMSANYSSNWPGMQPQTSYFPQNFYTSGYQNSNPAPPSYGSYTDTNMGQYNQPNYPTYSTYGPPNNFGYGQMSGTFSCASSAAQVQTMEPKNLVPQAAIPSNSTPVMQSQVSNSYGCTSMYGPSGETNQVNKSRQNPAIQGYHPYRH